MEIKKYSSEYRKRKGPRIHLGPIGDYIHETRRANLSRINLISAF